MDRLIRQVLGENGLHLEQAGIPTTSAQNIKNEIKRKRTSSTPNYRPPVPKRNKAAWQAVLRLSLRGKHAWCACVRADTTGGARHQGE